MSSSLCKANGTKIPGSKAAVRLWNPGPVQPLPRMRYLSHKSGIRRLGSNQQTQLCKASEKPLLDDQSKSSSGNSGSDAGVQAAYLEFGRLLGENPGQVQRGLQEAGLEFSDDEATRDYLEEWEGEEAESYDVFETLLNSERVTGSQTLTAATSRPNRKLMKAKATSGISQADLDEIRRWSTGQETQSGSNSTRSKVLMRNKGSSSWLDAGSMEVQPPHLATGSRRKPMFTARDDRPVPMLRRPGGSYPSRVKQQPPSSPQLSQRPGFKGAAQTAATRRSQPSPKRPADPQLSTAERDLYQQALARRTKMEEPTYDAFEAAMARGKPQLPDDGLPLPARRVRPTMRLPPSPLSTSQQQIQQQPSKAKSGPAEVAPLSLPPKMKRQPQQQQQPSTAKSVPLAEAPAPEMRLKPKQQQQQQPRHPQIKTDVEVAANVVPPKLLHTSERQQQQPQQLLDVKSAPVIEPAARPVRRQQDTSATAPLSDAATATLPDASAGGRKAAGVNGTVHRSPQQAARLRQEAEPRAERALGGSPEGSVAAELAATDVADAAESGPSRGRTSAGGEVFLPSEAPVRKPLRPHEAMPAAGDNLRPLPILKKRREIKQGVLQAARELLKEERCISVEAVNANAGGLLVKSCDEEQEDLPVIAGFLPLQQIGLRVCDVITHDLALQMRNFKSSSPEGVVPSETRLKMWRRDSLMKLRGTIMRVRVIEVVDDSIIFSERAATEASNRQLEHPELVVEAIRSSIGAVVQATVSRSMLFGVFVVFDVEVEVKGQPVLQEVLALIPRNRIATDSPNPFHPNDFQAGLVLSATVVGVGYGSEASGIRVTLALHQPAANTLNQTLEDLMDQGEQDGIGEEGNEEGTDSQGLRLTLGDLPEVVELCGLLEGADGVFEVRPGRRLRSVASSPTVQVLLGSKVSQLNDDLKRYEIIARRGTDVQVLELTAAANRDGVKKLVAAAVSELGKRSAAASP